MSAASQKRQTERQNVESLDISCWLTHSLTSLVDSLLAFAYFTFSCITSLCVCAVCFIVPMQIGFFRTLLFTKTIFYAVPFIHSIVGSFVHSFVYFYPHAHICIFEPGYIHVFLVLYYLFVQPVRSCIQYFLETIHSSSYRMPCVLDVEKMNEKYFSKIESDKRCGTLCECVCR